MGLFGAFVCCQPSKCNLILFVFIVIIKQFFFRISICTRLLFRAFFTYNRIKFHSIYRYEIFSPKNLAAKQYDAHCVSSWHLANTLGTLLCMQELPNPQTKVDTNTNHHCFCIVNFQYLLWLIVCSWCPKILDSLHSTMTCAMLSTIFK